MEIVGIIFSRFQYHLFQETCKYKSFWVMK